MASRIVFDSNKLWLFPWSDGTMSGRIPAGNELNTHDVPRNLYDWPHVGGVGTNSASTHMELEVFGVIFSGKRLEDLVKEMINHQVLVNQEGFMVMYFNVSAGDMYIAWDHSNLVRQLNDLFDWSKYGMSVPMPPGTVWDQFQLNTGKLMVDNKDVGQKEELEEENRKLKEELEEAKRKKNEEAKRKKNEENDELKAKQAADAAAIKKLKEDAAAKNKQISRLTYALRAFL